MVGKVCKQETVPIKIEAKLHELKSPPTADSRMSTCIRHSTPRLFKSLRSIHRYYSSSSSYESTYYVQSFINAAEHYILLLPDCSMAMGRMYLKQLAPARSVRNGPTMDLIEPISSDSIKLDWATFVENGGFRTILQNVVRENIAQDETVINDAKSLPGGEGWVHLCDERALPAYLPCL